MRLLLELGYQKLLLPTNADTNAILRALAGAVEVEEKSTTYSEPSKYAIKKADGISAPTFISDHQIIDEDEAVEMDIEELRKANARLSKERCDAAKELKALKEKVDGLTEQKKEA